MMKAVPVIHWPDRMARKASDVSVADWLYQSHVNYYRNIIRVLLRFFQGMEILEINRFYIISGTHVLT